MSGVGATGRPKFSRRVAAERAAPAHRCACATSTPRTTFLVAAALLFAASAAATIAGCRSMSAMGSMSMPGGWTLSMAWMRMDGQSWPGVAASFLVMWATMMVAMMLPALLPLLWRYRQAVEHTGETRLIGLVALAGSGHFAVWIAMGVPVFAAGSALVALALQWPLLARGVPVAIGVTVLLAGALQFSAWKARHLACCRAAPAQGRALSADFGAAWRYGLCVGVHGSYCCAGLTAILLVLGVMDWRVMAAVTIAITFERLAPAGLRAARAVGVAILIAGLVPVVRALGFG